MKQSPKMRETDNYMQARSEAESQEQANPWVRNFFQPAMVATLVWCVVWSVAHFAAELAPNFGPTLLWIAPVLMAIVGFTTQREMRKRLLSGTTGARSRMVELGVLFLLVKFLSYFDDTIPEVIADVRQWPENPASFFDTETVIAYLLGIFAWIGASLTARDLDAVEDPTMYMGETGPRQRLIGRYFMGGAALMLFAGLRRVNLMSVLAMDHPRIRGPIVNALIYFFLGLVLLGQIHLSRLAGLWRREKVNVTEGLSGTWIRYTLLLIGLAALVAFLLPTGYTVGILDLAAMVIFILSYIITFLYFLILWPLTMLVSLFTGRPSEAEAPKINRPSLVPQPPPVTAESGSPLWALLRSLLFWIVLIGVIVYLVRSYLRDRPELLEAARRLKPVQVVIQLWRGLIRLFQRVGRSVQSTVPKLVRRLRRSRPSVRRREEREQGAGLREKLLYHYLTTLDRAKEEGLPRRGPETPYEYQRTLMSHLSDETEAIAGLTDAFIVARYSTHPVSAEDIEQQSENAQRVQRALKRQKADEESETS